MVKETASQAFELSRRHHLSEFAAKSARKKILEETNMTLSALIHYMFYRLQLYSTARQLGQARSDPNIDYDYLALESIGLTTSLQTASLGDYSEFKLELQNHADELLMHAPGTSKDFAHELIACLAHIPDKGEPIDLPPLPWEDQNIINGYNQELEESNWY